jgi:dTDP-glucose pyrophosphorylase
MNDEYEMFRNRAIDINLTILQALKKMDLIDKKLLIVMDSDEFAGLLSAGDIQRAIIKSKSLETKIKEILRKELRIGATSDSRTDIRDMMYKYRMELCPIIDEENKVVEVCYWEDLFDDKKPKPLNKFKIPIVIMAGGLGTRLKPLTNVFPKPLIPVGDKTIIEEIFNRFYQHGCDEFIVSTNYKAELVKYYLDSLNLPFSIDYLKESMPLGTGGSLSLLKNRFDSTLAVSNCDIIIEQDYSEILEYHHSNKNELTIVAALKHYPVAYGTIESGIDGELVEMVEKPELTFKINSGVYILEPHLLDEIPESTFYNITDLIDDVKARKGRVGVYPVSEKSWKDIGNWSDYLKLVGITNDD